MKKVLILPLLNSMPSGHHQVADAICETLLVPTEEIECIKLDILSEWNRQVEKSVVKTYLHWIRSYPKTYAWTYRQFAYRSKRDRQHSGYEILFMKTVKTVLKREQPDLIVCTHGFPSLFVNRLKKSGECQVPTLNIYTDFFVNDIWGCSHIDYHFVPSGQVKQELSAKRGVDSDRIFITGIPVSAKFKKRNGSQVKKAGEPLRILLSGGSVGLGSISETLKKKQKEMDCRIKVLCGANIKLYKELERLSDDAIEPYPYISSKEQMNRIYEDVDAIISKPGGVTVSEAICKELPIFVPSALPGQEQINLQLLTEMGLVFVIPHGEDVLDFTCRTIQDEEKMRNFKKAAATYKKSLELDGTQSVYNTIQAMLERG